MSLPLESLCVRLLRRLSYDGDCWIWTGPVGNHGYGALNARAVPTAHRAAYMLWVGPIPGGYDVHHTCGRKLCFNPVHLTVVERIAHRRMHQAMDETCGRGHLRSEHTTVKRDGTRYCRACRREADRRRSR